MTRTSTGYADYGLRTHTKMALEKLQRKAVTEKIPSTAIVNDFRTDVFDTKNGPRKLNCACDQFGRICLYHWYYEIQARGVRVQGGPYRAHQEQQPEPQAAGDRGQSGSVRDGGAQEDRRRGQSSVRGDSPQPGNRSPGRSRRG